MAEPQTTTEPTLEPIYVASRASIPERGQMWRDFRAQGVRITSSWIDEDGEGQTGDFGELWLRIVNEIRDAVALVLYAKAADFPLKGALTEAGLALGMGKPVIVCLPDLGVLPHNYRPIGSWIAHPLVTRCDDIEAAVRLATRSRVSVPSIAPVGDEDLLTPLDEIESALISIAEGTSPEDAVRQVFDVINRERLKLSAAPASTVAPQEQSDVVHWQLRAGADDAMCGTSLVEGSRVTLLSDTTTCDNCKIAAFGYKVGRADERDASPAAPKSLLREPVKVDALSPLVVTRNGIPCPDQEVALEEFKEACRVRAEQLDKAEADQRVAEPRYGERTCKHCDKPIKNTPRRPNRWTHVDTASLFCEPVSPSTAANAADKIADQLIPHLDHAFLLTKGWRDQIASIIERSLSSGS